MNANLQGLVKGDGKTKGSQEGASPRSASMGRRNAHFTEQGKRDMYEKVEGE